MAAVAGRPSALQRGSCKLQQTAAGLRHGGTHGPGMTRSTVVVVIASIAALVVLVLAGRRVLERDRDALYAHYAAVRTQDADEAAHELAKNLADIREDLELAATLVDNANSPDVSTRELHAIATIKREYDVIDARPHEAGGVPAHVVAFDTPAGVAAMAVTAMTAALDAADGARATLQLSPALQQAGEPEWYRVFARRSAEPPGAAAGHDDARSRCRRVARTAVLTCRRGLRLGRRARCQAVAAVHRVVGARARRTEPVARAARARRMQPRARAAAGGGGVRDPQPAARGAAAGAVAQCTAGPARRGSAAALGEARGGRPARRRRRDRGRHAAQRRARSHRARDVAPRRRPRRGVESPGRDRSDRPRHTPDPAAARLRAPDAGCDAADRSRGGARRGARPARYAGAHARRRAGPRDAPSPAGDPRDPRSGTASASQPRAQCAGCL